MIEQKWQKGKPVTVCLPRCSIPIPAPQRPRIPPALGMLVKHPGWRLILLWGKTKAGGRCSVVMGLCAFSRGFNSLVQRVG